jgi:tRNA G37 N-methylase TrmD
MPTENCNSRFTKKFSLVTTKQIDDTQFGGGAGMVLMINHFLIASINCCRKRL